MLSNTDCRRLSMAAVAARKSVHRHRVGAVVVSGGSVVARGHNRVRMVDMRPYDMCTDHAEEVALRAAGEQARGSVLYVARVGAGGASKLAKPCPRCMKHIIQCGVKRVVWTTDGGGTSSKLKEGQVG